MKRLFKEDNEDWDKEAFSLSNELSIVIRPILERWSSMGYSTRDIQNVARSTIEDETVKVVCDKIIS